MSSGDLIIRSRRVLLAGALRPASIRIRSGRIAEISDGAAPLGADAEVDAADAVVMPGLVDTHVHVNEPGRTEWEGFESATRAAAAGGITTLLDMPLNSVPPTTTRAALADKIEHAAGRCRVDVGFWGGVVPGNTAELAGLQAAGAFGFKCFLAPSGVAEFAEVNDEQLLEAARELARIDGLLLVHAESSRRLRDAWKGSRSSYAAYLATRPCAAEDDAVERLIAVCRESGVRVHILHLSSLGALEPLARAKGLGLPVTVETCPHYLCFAAEEIPDGATEFKCAPPVREGENRERLWMALREGLIDLVVSDHSPSPPALKHRQTGDFSRAWGGISSLELTLSVVWTAASARGVTIPELARWMCAAPARLAGLDALKGSIEVGRDADLVIWNPEAGWTVDPERLQQRHKLTPYAGCALKGIVEQTYLKGRKIYERGRFPSPPSGEILLSG